MTELTLGAAYMAQINQYSWMDKVIDIIDEKIKTLPKKRPSKYHKIFLQQKNPLNALNDTQNQFVVIPRDKANQNVAFVYELFCALVLIKELGLDHNNTGTNKTYISVDEINNQIISDNTTFLRSKLNLVVDEENKKLPQNLLDP